MALLVPGAVSVGSEVATAVAGIAGRGPETTEFAETPKARLGVMLGPGGAPCCLRVSSAIRLRIDARARREISFRVSKTPTPWMAAASKEGFRRG